MGKTLRLNRQTQRLTCRRRRGFPQNRALHWFSKIVSKIVFEIFSEIIFKLVSKIINISKHLIVLEMVSNILASGFSGLYRASTIGAGYAAKALPEPSPFFTNEATTT